MSRSLRSECQRSRKTSRSIEILDAMFLTQLIDHQTFRTAKTFCLYYKYYKLELGMKDLYIHYFLFLTLIGVSYRDFRGIKLIFISNTIWC